MRERIALWLEFVLYGSFACLVGLFVALQLPLSVAFGETDWGYFACSLAFAALVCDLTLKAALKLRRSGGQAKRTSPRIRFVSYTLAAILSTVATATSVYMRPSGDTWYSVFTFALVAGYFWCQLFARHGN